ncbi:alpha/beta hydrolase family protein [Estrella lausannensis]|uniref:Uncharacterized protein n=1 Tax=Estrella lausannensis TaxID=483423 RepID=A0A0H5DP54_9BACT|nr:dipeptidyl aminopeptidase [Estrella lausannensis]CRX38276.1 Conserved hypothetical protein [Estrella lausannensis]
MEFIKDLSFNQQFIRTLGHAARGGADLGECLALIPRIIPGNFESWHDAFHQLGNQLRENAAQESSKQHFFSAGKKLLRASNYYRTAYFFLEENPGDPRIKERLEESKESFAKALDFLAIPHVMIQIPFEGSSLPAILYPSAVPDAKLLIDTGGGDSTLEELYFQSAVAARERGYHCLTFEGPGQGSVLRLGKTPFRPDWEVVIKAVLDFIDKTYPAMKSRVALRGDSFGGYLAVRAAAYEKRIKACVVNPGIFGVSKGLEKLPGAMMTSLLFALKPALRFKIKSRYMRFGVKNLQEMKERCREYTLEGKIKNISCPTLVFDNEEEHLTQGEALKLYQTLECPKKYYVFKKEQRSGGHCQPFLPHETEEVLFDWLDEVLSIT